MTSTNTELVRDPKLDEVLDQMSDWILRREPVTMGSVFPLLLDLIPIIEKTVMGENRGVYKKLLLLAVVDEILEERGASDGVRDFVGNALPFVVDVMIGLARGRIDIGKTATVTLDGKGCLPCRITPYKKKK